jgi:N-acetylmuramoyl-L-alanine amidase
MMKIKNGRLVGASFKLARSYRDSKQNPRMIVLHDTAGRLDKFSSVNWFCSKECKTSAHIVVERDGTITQQVPFDKVAFHAGASSWKCEDGVNRKMCNSCSIGIEIVNPGQLDKNGKAWFHKAKEGYPIDGLVHKKTPEHGDGWWMPYTPEQVKAIKELCRALVEEYPDCNEIVTHYLISPRRKIDVNPLFPLEDVRAYAFGDVDPEVPDVPIPVPATKPVSEPAPSAVAVADLHGQSTKVGFLIWMRRSIYGVFGGLTLTSVTDALQFTKGVFNDVASFVHDQAMVLAIGSLFVGGASITWLLNRTAKDAREGRYVPSKSAGAGLSPLPGPQTPGE